MLYENRKNMYKNIGAVIYAIIDDYICNDYLSLLQEKLSKYDNNFEKPGSSIFLGWQYLRL